MISSQNVKLVIRNCQHTHQRTSSSSFTSNDYDIFRFLFWLKKIPKEKIFLRIFYVGFTLEHDLSVLNDGGFWALNKFRSVKAT